MVSQGVISTSCRNVVGHLASAMPVGAWFKSLWVRGTSLPRRVYKGCHPQLWGSIPWVDPQGFPGKKIDGNRINCFKGLLYQVKQVYMIHLKEEPKEESDDYNVSTNACLLKQLEFVNVQVYCSLHSAHAPCLCKKLCG
jgi:hypothetical protein